MYFNPFNQAAGCNGLITPERYRVRMSWKPLWKRTLLLCFHGEANLTGRTISPVGLYGATVKKKKKKERI